MVWIQFCKEEKYGRLMGTMYLVNGHRKNKFRGEHREIQVNQWMINQGFGKEYNGGKKTVFTKRDLNNIISKN